MGFSVGTDEAARLAALHEAAILDTPPEQLFDDLARLAATICGTPIAAVTLVDADRQWAKAVVGTEEREVARDASYCARTITAKDDLLVVPGPPFYAGAAITTGEGHALGAVCVADTGPRELGPDQVDALRMLARQAAAHLELRRQAMRLHDADAELQRLAVEDTLTGVATRTVLFDRLSLALRLRRRSGRPLGVLFCDIEALRSVNDHLGREAGDEVLRTVADRLVDAARDSDTVARLAGDEFVVLCPELSAPGDIHIVAERLSAAVSRPIRLGDLVTTPRVAIGTALAGDGHDAGGLLRSAERSMRAARRPAVSTAVAGA